MREKAQRVLEAVAVGFTIVAAVAIAALALAVAMAVALAPLVAMDWLAWRGWIVVTSLFRLRAVGFLEFQEVLVLALVLGVFLGAGGCLRVRIRVRDDRTGRDELDE